MHFFILGDYFECDAKHDAAAIKGIELFSSGEMLTLPQSFGYVVKVLNELLNILQVSQASVIVELKDFLLKIPPAS